MASVFSVRVGGVLPYRVTVVLVLLLFISPVVHARSQDELFSQAKTSFKTIQYNAAIEAYQAAIEADPKSDTAIRSEFEIARTYYYLMNMDTCISLYEAFAAAHPAHSLAARAQKWIGDAHLFAGRTADAEAAYGKVVSQYQDDPIVPETLYELARIHLRKGLRDKAIDELNVILQGYPDAAIIPQVQATLEKAKAKAASAK